MELPEMSEDEVRALEERINSTYEGRELYDYLKKMSYHYMAHILDRDGFEDFHGDVVRSTVPEKRLTVDMYRFIQNWITTNRKDRNDG